MNSFLQLDLRGKITTTLLAAALALGAVMVLTSYVLFRNQLIQNTEALLEAHALLEQREIELRLAGIITLAESLAVNPVTANALADSRGRETYLDPLLRNQRLTVTGADITVVDYRGRIAASTHTNPPDYSTNSSFQAMMKSGQATQQIEQTGQPSATLLLALPIRYRLTNNVEGG
ncbi:MAG: hypothetical protein U9R55_00220, partial [Pseudomonadota bacterium]|nr:hypothetical protein [Pseudomonadota bacterium]